MVSNLLDVEAKAMEWIITVGHRATMWSFDIAAALPSLSHEFLFAVLTAMEIPARVLAMLKMI